MHTIKILSYFNINIFHYNPEIIILKPYNTTYYHAAFMFRKYFT